MLVSHTIEGMGATILTVWIANGVEVKLIAGNYSQESTIASYQSGASIDR
jgi:hypothetical protein